MKSSAAPVRTCVGCRRTAAKEEFVRIVRGVDGEVRIDDRGSAPGRGAYVCSNVGCFERALGKGRLERALRTRLDGPGLQRLMKEFAQRT